MLASLRPVGLWRAFDTLGSGRTLMITWRSLLGQDFSIMEPFLQPLPEHSFTYPCTFNPWCQCDHEVYEDPEWEQVGVCTCGECQPIPLTRQDTILYALNHRAFGEALRYALGFTAPGIPARPSTPNHQLAEIALYAPLHAPVYFYAPTSPTALLAQIHATLASHPGPFFLLTPTPACYTPEIDAVLKRAACAHAALTTILAPARLAAPGSYPSHGPTGRRGTGEGFLPTNPAIQQSINPQLQPTLDRWAAALAASRDSTPALLSIHREIAAVRKDFVELRTARERLEKMQAEGMFAFTRKVDATSFKTLCTILAEGDVSKAGRRLAIKDSTLRYMLDQWQDRGPAYRAMLDLVRWRKKIGRKETLPLNDAILHERADTTDYPGLLSDVLDGLLSMTEENWQDLCEELAEFLRPAVAAANQANPTHATPIRGAK